MLELPVSFIEDTRTLMGEHLFSMLMEGLQAPSPVSIRLNPVKCNHVWKALGEPVPWCREGVYLAARPDFTFDPLLHAGLYYVQEASSMVVDYLVRTLVHEPVMMLDLCAAPGGKSTCVRGALPAGSWLFCNEPIRNRAQVLLENVLKYGHPDVTVTCDYARDYRRAGLTFDIILADVPCSGEGMFRKDEGATREWSPRNVAHCVKLQREIISDIWPCLRPGGLLIYSTCTFNAHEDEENVAWIADELGADSIELETPAGWHITGPLMGTRPVCRFLPGVSRGEGLFVAVLRKQGDSDSVNRRQNEKRAQRLHVMNCFTQADMDDRNALALQARALQVLRDEPSGVPTVDVDYATAIAYLRREAVVLSADIPRGHVLLTYQGVPLGYCKHVGNRANNLYPAEWRIRSTHFPATAPDVLRWA